MIKKRLLSVALSVFLLAGTVFVPGVAVGADTSPVTLTTASGTVKSYSSLQTAFADAANGDTITLNANLAESAVYTGISGKTVTLNGQGHTLTGVNNTSDDVSDFALEVTGAGVLNLKSITLAGNTINTVGSSAGLYTDAAFSGTVISLGSVAAVGGVSDVSFGVASFGSSGTININTASGADNSTSGTSVGVYNANSTGTVNVGSALGGNLASTSNSTQSMGVFSTNGTVNVGTAKAGTANNVSAGLYIIGGSVNANSAESADILTRPSGNSSVISAGVYASNATVNVGTAACGSFNDSASSISLNAVMTLDDTAVINAGAAATTSNTSGGTINVGSDKVHTVTLNAGSVANSPLSSLTVAGSGSTTVGALPSVAKNGAAGSWYTDKALKTKFTGTTIDPTVTALYSSFYTFGVSGKITGSDGAALAATLQLKNSSGSVVATQTAGSDGSYSFTGLNDTETYTIAVSKDGYTAASIGPFTVAGADITAKNLQLAKIAASSTSKPTVAAPSFGKVTYSTRAITRGPVTVTVTALNATVSSVSYKFTRNGSHTFTIANSAGVKVSKTLTIHNIDKTKPTIKATVKNGKSTKHKVKVTVKDAHLKSKAAARNGKKIAWGSGTFKKKGSYVITAADKAGNNSSYNFKIQ